MIRCIIIDDDPFMRDLLTDKLAFFDDIEVLGTAKDGAEGLEKIKKLNPNLVLLDVEMTDMTGFEMLSRLEKIDFQTIFVTSYGHYAIKAIRFNALDYLLKPVDLEELYIAIERFHQRHTSQNKERVKRALSNMNESYSDQRLFLTMQEGELDIPLKEITFIQGERNYSNIHLESGRKILVAKTLVDLEELLTEKGFFRCHKSYIVGSSHIASAGRERIHMKSGQSLTLSRRKKEGFMEWWKTKN